MQITEANHIRELIAEGKVKPLPIQISRDFGKFLESYPLLLPLGASIDWSKMPAHDAIEWYEKSDQQIVEWARRLRLGRCSHVAVWYNSEEPCLLATLEFGIANLDTLTWEAPGPRYVFGVNPDGDKYHCAFHAILEVTGGRLLHGVL